MSLCDEIRIAANGNAARASDLHVCLLRCHDVPDEVPLANTNANGNEDGVDADGVILATFAPRMLVLLDFGRMAVEDKNKVLPVDKIHGDDLPLKFASGGM